MKTTETPKTQLEAVRKFADENTAHSFLVGMRWPDGVICPHCQSKNVGDLSISEAKTRKGTITVRRVWNCKACKGQFTAKVGTIFEDSALPLSKLLPAVWMICNAKNGISSCELARSIGITQKSAWFLLHRIRTAMQNGSIEKLKGDVEIDETYVGGKARFMHASRRRRLPNKTGVVGKSVVMGMLERDGAVRVKHVKNPKLKTMVPMILETIEPGSTVHTDKLASYQHLNEKFQHEVIDHAVEYVRGNVHTNSLENFWSLLKRTLKGTYVSCDPAHLQKYVDEQVTRFNERKDNDAGRFLSTLSRVFGRRLTWNELTGKTEMPSVA